MLNFVKNQLSTYINYLCNIDIPNRYGYRFRVDYKNDTCVFKKRVQINKKHIEYSFFKQIMI